MNAYGSLEYIDSKVRVQAVRYVFVAIYAVLVWDSVLLIENERRLIHRSSWSLLKAAYLLCRYYPIIVWPSYIWGLVVDHGEEFCRCTIQKIYVLRIPLQLFPQVVLVMRAWAFTRRNAFVLISLSTVLCCSLALQIWFYIKDLSDRPLLYVAWTTGSTSCHLEDAHLAQARFRRMAYLMFAAVGVDALATLAVVLQYFLSPVSRSQLGRLILYQGFIFFILITILNGMSAMLWLRRSLVKNLAAVGWYVVALVFSNMLACRLILQLRESVSPTETQIRQQVSDLVEIGLVERRPSRRSNV